MSSTGLVTFAYPSTDGGTTVDDGGSLITSYVVRVKDGSNNLVGTYKVTDLSSLQQQLSGLTAGTPYTVSVVAINDVGPSAPATVSYTPSPTYVSRVGRYGCWGLAAQLAAHQATAWRALAPTCR